MGRKQKSRNNQKNNIQNELKDPQNNKNFKNSNDLIPESGNWQTNTRRKQKTSSVEEVVVQNAPVSSKPPLVSTLSDIPIIERRCPSQLDDADLEFFQMMDEMKKTFATSVKDCVDELIRRVEGFEYKFNNKINSYFDDMKNKYSARSIRKLTNASSPGCGVSSKCVERFSESSLNEVFSNVVGPVTSSEQDVIPLPVNGIPSNSGSTTQALPIIVSDRVARGDKGFSPKSTNTKNSHLPILNKVSVPSDHGNTKTIQNDDRKFAVKSTVKKIPANISDGEIQKEQKTPQFQSKLTEDTYKWFVEKTLGGL